MESQCKSDGLDGPATFVPTHRRQFFRIAIAQGDLRQARVPSRSPLHIREALLTLHSPVWVMAERTRGTKRLFLTVGTTSFDRLVDAVDQITFLDKLAALGFSRFIMQIGRWDGLRLTRE